MSENRGDRLYSLTDAAALLGCSRWTLYRWIKANKTPTERYGTTLAVRLNDLRELTNKVNAKQTA